MTVACAMLSCLAAWLIMRHRARTQRVDESAEEAYQRLMAATFERAFQNDPEAFRGSLRYEQWQKSKEKRYS